MLETCKICFKSFNYQGISFLNESNHICSNCFNAFDVRFYHTKIDNIKTLILYNYNEFFREKLYLFKGCKDIELNKVFLSRFIIELRLKYHGFIIVPIPSTIKDDEERGFNHIVEISKNLNLPIACCLYKKKDFKQSENTKIKREKSINMFGIDEKTDLKGKKILLIDDVITTRTSLKAAIKLVKKISPSKIEALILSKKF